MTNFWKIGIINKAGNQQPKIISPILDLKLGLALDLSKNQAVIEITMRDNIDRVKSL